MKKLIRGLSLLSSVKDTMSRDSDTIEGEHCGVTLPGRCHKTTTGEGAEAAEPDVGAVTVQTSAL